MDDLFLLYWYTDIDILVALIMELYPVQMHRSGINGLKISSLSLLPLYLVHFCYCCLGYGHIVPTTPVGKIVSIFYAVLGVPLFLLYLSNIGKLIIYVVKIMFIFLFFFKFVLDFKISRSDYFFSARHTTSLFEVKQSLRAH